MKKYYHDGDGIIRQVRYSWRHKLINLYNFIANASVIFTVLLMYAILTFIAFQIDLSFGAGYILLGIVCLLGYWSSIVRTNKNE